MTEIIKEGKRPPALVFKCNKCECVARSDEYQTKPIPEVFRRRGLECGDAMRTLACPNCKSTMYEYKHWSISEA